MDPLSAFSLAAGVIQVADFSSRVVRESYSLIKSGRETPKCLAEIAKLNGLNGSVCDKTLATLSTRSPHDEDESLLHGAVDTCRERVAALSDLMSSLTVESRPDGSKSKRQQVKVSVLSQFKRSDIEAQVKKVEEAQTQLSIAFLNLIQ